MPDDGLAVTRTGVPPLTRFGLTPDADLVFRTLAGYGPATVTGLSLALGTPGGRVRAALDELAECGIARRERGQWHGSSAGAAVSRLRGRLRATRQARTRVDGWLAHLSGVDVGFSVDRRRSLTVRPLHGAARVRARIGELVGSIRHEHLSMQPEPAFSRSDVKAAALHDQALASRRVSVLTLGVPPADHDATGTHTGELVRQGVRYRELPTLPAKFMVFDRSVAILPLDPADPGRGAVELSTTATVEDLVAWFLRRWDVARPPGPAPTAAVLSPRERAVVGLLSVGHTDAGTAQRLGISVRTVGSTMRGLMDRFGVQNRFQLGLILGASTDQWGFS